MESAFNDVLLFIAVMVEFLLKGDNELSTLSSVAFIPSSSGWVH